MKPQLLRSRTNSSSFGGLVNFFSSESDMENLMKADFLPVDLENTEYDLIKLENEIENQVGNPSSSLGKLFFEELEDEILKKNRSVGVKSKRDIDLGTCKKFDSNAMNRILEAFPPKYATENDYKTLAYDTNYGNHHKALLSIVTQPPLEVRTRTKNENRTFACTARLRENQNIKAKTATVRLCYAKDYSTFLPILGGTLTKPVQTGGLVEFDDLSVSVASPKHSEREFALCVTLDGESAIKDKEVCSAYSRPFYAYSHKSVLKRRRELELRALSHQSGLCQGGLSMHVVGSPFIRSERLQVVFRVKIADYNKYCSDKGALPIESTEESDWVSIPVENFDYFSDSVLFFETPRNFEKCKDQDIDAFVQVTNDGRNFSNPLPFTFISGSDMPVSPAKKLCIMSRM